MGKAKSQRGQRRKKTEKEGMQIKHIYLSVKYLIKKLQSKAYILEKEPVLR
jgi:hypothetical protein